MSITSTTHQNGQARRLPLLSLRPTIEHYTIAGAEHNLRLRQPEAKLPRTIRDPTDWICNACGKRITLSFLQLKRIFREGQGYCKKCHRPCKCRIKPVRSGPEILEKIKRVRCLTLLGNQEGQGVPATVPPIRSNDSTWWRCDICGTSVSHEHDQRAYG